MNELQQLFAGGLGVVVLIFCIVISILWLLVPFAVFGLLDRVKKTEKLLTEMRDLMRTQAGMGRGNRF